MRFEAPNTAPWNSSETNAAALFAGVSATDQNLLQMANLKVAASKAIAFALETRIPRRTELQTRDQDGDLEAVARYIEDGL